MIISIDPHKSRIAAVHWWGDNWNSKQASLQQAEFIKGSLQDLIRWVMKFRNSTWDKRGADLALIETMFVYPTERIKDPNDLLEVSKVVGLCHMLAPEVIEYKAREWKGQVPKKIMNERILDTLSLEEISRLGKYKNNEHVLDAAGIGLHYLGRLKRRIS